MKEELSKRNFEAGLKAVRNNYKLKKLPEKKKVEIAKAIGYMIQHKRGK